MAEPFRVGPLSVDEATGNITSTGNVTTTGTITSSAGELASSLDTLSDTTITAAVKGDTLVYNGTAWIDVTVGANDEVLTADSAQASGVKWAVIPTKLANVIEDTTPQLGGSLDVNGQSIVSASAGNIVVTPDTTGSIVLDGVNWPQADGTANQVLTTDGGGQLSWADDADSIDSLSDTTITTAAKGETLVYDGAAWIDVTVGANDEVLTADSAQASGVKWAASGGGGGGSKTLVQAFDIGGTPVASIDFLSLDNSFQFYELEIFEWSGDSTSSSFRFFASADNFVSGGVTVQSSMVDGKSDGTTVGRLSAPFGSGIFPIPAAISGDSPNNVNNPVGAALTDFSGITCKFLLRGIGQSKLFSFSCRGQLFNSSRLHDFAAAGVYPDSSGTPYSVNAVRISMSGGNMIRGSGVLWGINNV